MKKSGDREIARDRVTATPQSQERALRGPRVISAPQSQERALRGPRVISAPQSQNRALRGPRVIGKTGVLLTTEARRHGEKRNAEIALNSGQVQMGLDRENGLSFCHPERAPVEPCETSTSRRIAVLPGFGNAESGSSSHAFDFALRRLKSAWQIIRAAFREIFDESAYDRFLKRTKVPHSAESYRAFQRECESAVARKPRCC